MTKIQICVRLEPEVLEAHDVICKLYGISRSDSVLRGTNVLAETIIQSAVRQDIISGVFLPVENIMQFVTRAFFTCQTV